MFNQQPNQGSAIGQNVGSLLYIGVEGCALSIEVFLHRHFGARYIGFQGLVATALIGVFIVFCGDHGHDPRPMILFLVAYLVLVACARLDAFRRTMRGDKTHSRYSGTPWLIKPNARLSEITIKKFVEPIVVLGIAALISDYNQPLAAYLIVAVSCLVGSNLRAAMWMRGRVMDMNDAVADQEQVAQQFRDMRGDHF